MFSRTAVALFSVAALAQTPKLHQIDWLRPDMTVEANADPVQRALQSELARTDWSSRLDLDPRLPDPYARWLAQDVAWIITDLERAQFLALASDADRVRFIEAFWQRRDPDPATPENRFKEEHYRRIAYSNARFAVDGPGWQSDRGRLYIQLGPADEIESHPARQLEVWLYRRIPGVSSPLRLTFQPR